MTNYINLYQKECDRLKETCQLLEKDFGCVAKEGEEKKDFDFIFKATAIKQKCEDKKLEMKNLQDKIMSWKLRDKRCCEILFFPVVQSFCFICISVVFFAKVLLILFIFHGYFVSKNAIASNIICVYV